MRFSITLALSAFALALVTYYFMYAARLETLGAIAFFAPVVRSAFYVGLAIGACTYAIRCGGTPERVAGIVVLATLAAHVLLRLIVLPSFARVDPVILIVDLSRLIAFFVLALRADRLWTLWFAALQLLATGAHVAMSMGASIHPVIYATGMTMWTYGMLVLLIAATRHHQRLIERGEKRKSWTDFSHRSRGELREPQKR